MVHLLHEIKLLLLKRYVVMMMKMDSGGARLARANDRGLA
jgi:hypothetical protein